MHALAFSIFLGTETEYRHRLLMESIQELGIISMWWMMSTTTMRGGASHRALMLMTRLLPTEKWKGLAFRMRHALGVAYRNM